MRCALLSRTIDLRRYLAAEISRLEGLIEFVDYEEGRSQLDVQMAVAWHPPLGAFDRYPNLAAVCSIGAGVDNIIASPGLRDDVDIVRVVCPIQAEMMSGFVIWHVIGRQRNFSKFREQQRDRIWKRQPQRPPSQVVVGVLGHGSI